MTTSLEKFADHCKNIHTRNGVELSLEKPHEESEFRNVTGRCKQCDKKVGILGVPVSSLHDYFVRGELIQRALPMLNNEEREFLISGICGSCFDVMFPEEER